VKKESKNKKKEASCPIDESEAVIHESDIIVVDHEEEGSNDDYSESKVGTTLRKARLKSGKKISDVAKDLCIRKVYLDAIEASNYAEIPDYPYGPGFVRSYADYLGLNGSRLVQLFKDETNTKKDEELFMPEPQKEITAPNHKYLLISIAAILALYFVWFLFNREKVDLEEVTVVEEPFGNDMNFVVQVEDFITEETARSEKEAVSSMENIVIKDASYVEPSADAPSVEPVSRRIPNDRIFLDIKDDVWVEVKDANDTLFLSKELRAGDSYVLPQRPGLILSAGRAGAIDVYVYGKLTDVITRQRRMNIHLDDFRNQ
jgi:cytoskeleton protein RodZ